jgi:hypothetical protein
MFRTYVQRAIPEAKMQRTLSQAVEQEKARCIIAQAESSLPTLVRLQSTSAKHASGWLNATPTLPATRIATEHFCALVRHRLGLRISASPTACRFCKTAISDVFGRHSLSCGYGGAKSRVHKAVCRELTQVAWGAGREPHAESQCFRTPGLRADILIKDATGHATALDFAVTHPMRAANIRIAARTPGGAATYYESVKTRK